MKKLNLFLLLLISFITITGCGVQSIPMAKNETEAQLAEVTNQYKRRADLIPNLVKVVKSYAKHEQETLSAVTNARAKATSMSLNAASATPDQVAAYSKAQGQLSQALGRLMMVSERYPNLKADTNFRDLQAQLEGTENRITVARKRYIESIKKFNNLITVFPTSLTNSLFFNHEKMKQWTVDQSENVEKAPTIDL